MNAVAEQSSRRASCGRFPDDWREDHGDRLFREGVVAKPGQPRAAVLLGLLLLCLVLRVRSAIRLDILSPDAVSYVGWAEALEAGDVSTAFEYTGLNIYPLILLGLKALPGDWLMAAEWWSVLMATLAVLPIYGWIRRQFNETLAILGSGFYAMHPAMVDDSALVVRDPTFWLLFALGLYSAWRSAAELQYRWLGLFAVVFGLAIHLRTEAWLLLPVLVIWMLFRLRLVRGRRVAAILATLLAVSIGPLGGKLIQEVAMPGVKGESTGNNRHLERMEQTVASPDTPPIAQYVYGTMSMTACYVKSFGYLHSLLAGVGLIHWKRRLFGPSKGALLLFCLLSAGAVWVCFCLIHMDQRYTFPSVIVSLPTVAAGLCLVATKLTEAGNRRGWQYSTGFSFWLLCLILVSVAILSAIIVISPRKQHHDQAALGRWIRARFGPEQSIAVSVEPQKVRVVYFYAGKPCLTWTPPDDGDGLNPGWRSIETSAPRAILLWIDGRVRTGRNAYTHGIRKAKELGYREVPAVDLPAACREILVLVRDEPGSD